MAAVINTNIPSLNSQRNLTMSQNSLNTSIQRLSSGLRINSAKDDAAGLAISQRMTSQINGLNRAAQNANDGISLSQTAEGALGQVGDSLQRIRELAVQSANATNSSSDRAALQQEVSQLVSEITRIGNTTSFNGLKILDGSYTDQQYQIGANAGETINVSIADSRSDKMGATTLTSSAGVETSDAAFDPTAVLTINGTTIETGDAANLNDIVTAINAKSNDTGVTAARATANTFNAGALATTAASEITINGTAITLDGSTTALTTQTIADAINAKSTQTGVSASLDAGNLILSSANGADFTVQSTGTALTTAGNVDATEQKFEAGIVLSAKLGSTIDAAGALATPLNVPAVAADAQVDLQVSTMDISTVDGANKALATVDAALTQVSSTRAQLGAIQNRFTAVVANLSTTAENLTASRSRIQDADFAAETANMTRGQILQQAGTAMLAQANSLPNGVLALLRG